MNSKIKWPDGKDFAFSVFDDTDNITLENVPPVYSFLNEHGFKTTKSVWPLKNEGIPLEGGLTCEDKAYLEWVKKLQAQGFEISLHNVSYSTSERSQTQKGIEVFKDYFGTYPKSHANHYGTNESMYWGDDRISGIFKFIYNMLTRYKKHNSFKGHVEQSELFWGDICKEKIKYVRNFVYPEINTLKKCPYMPYHDPKKPYVNYWFASSEGPNVESFVKSISEEKQDLLIEEGGACIMYTHFAHGFYTDGKLNPRFETLMKRLSEKNGWFAPVSTMLDYILTQRGKHVLSFKERFNLELNWILNKILIGGTS